MSYTFRNFNLKVIRELLEQIGEYRYKQALKLLQIEQAPLTMKGFFLEANEHCIFLCHKYPSRVIIKIMKVEEYEVLPKEGWIMVRDDKI